MTDDRNAEVCSGEEQAGDEAGTRYQRRGRALEADAAAGGGTPCARGGHAMEPERRRHQFQSLRALPAWASLQEGPCNTPQQSIRGIAAWGLAVTGANIEVLVQIE